jgi:hypothetical protein
MLPRHPRPGEAPRPPAQQRTSAPAHRPGPACSAPPTGGLTAKSAPIRAPITRPPNTAKPSLTSAHAPDPRPRSPRPNSQPPTTAQLPAAREQRPDLRGRNWDRTSDPSLVRPATTTPPPAHTLVSAGQWQQDRAQPSSRKPPRAKRAPICAPIQGSAAAAVAPRRPQTLERRPGRDRTRGAGRQPAQPTRERPGRSPRRHPPGGAARSPSYGRTALGACPWTTSEPASACRVHAGRSRCRRWRHLGEHGASGICPVTAIK